MSEQPTTPVAPEQPVRKNPLWWGEVVGGFFIAVLIVIALGGIAIYTLSGTDWGRERVRRIAQDFLQKEATGGKVRIGRITGNLLTGMTVHDFVITDSANKPFIAVKRITGTYGIGDIISRRIWTNDLVLEQPILVLDRPPNGAWNYKRIFPGDSARKTADGDNRPGWLDRMQFRNSRIIEGTVIVRSPWAPNKRLAKAAADSAVRAALAGDSRLVIDAVPGGYQKITEVRSIDAILPLVRLSEPGFPERLAEVSTLNALAFPFRPPPADIRDFRGQLKFTDDSVWWKGATVHLPNTVATGDGSYAFNTGDLTLKAKSPRADFADLRWVYPRMPTSTRGSLNFDLKWREGREEYVATNMNLTSGEARIRGNVGVTMTDTVAIHNTDLRFSQVSTVFLEQLIPDFKSPRRGVLTGRARVHGGRNALVVDGDVAFADNRAGTSRIVANGEIGFPGPGRGLRAENLRVRMSPFQVELARAYFPDLPLSGIINGTATLNGNTTSEMRVVADIVHVDRGASSAVAGRGTFSLAGDQRFAVDAVAKPVSLLTLGRFMPAAGLHGSASGPFTVRGTLSNLRVTTNLSVSGGGHVDARAFADLKGTKRYDVTATLRAVNLAAISTKGPETSLTGRATVTGTGTEPATMTATVAADLRSARWADFAVDTASVRATVRGGLAQIPWLYLAGNQIRASASGSFGLTRSRAGTLQYAVAVDSVRALARWVPALGPDTGVVRPRPALVARALQVARGDSAREARDTEVERIVTGKAPPKLKVNMPRTVARDSASGLLRASGTISGNIHNFDLVGVARGQDVALRGHFVRRFQSNYAWMNARTPTAKLAVGLDADSLMVGGFALDSVLARVSYDKPGGHVDVKVVQDARRDYQLNADYLLSQARNELRVGNLQLRLDTALWRSPRTSLISWGGPGIRVADFELRNGGNGRIYANGLLPTEGVANFTLAVDNLPVANFADLLESDLGLSGNLDLSGAMSGTLRDPRFRGAFAILRGSYQGTTLPDLRGTFGYADQQLVTHVDALRNGGAAMAMLDGRLPINLALSGVTGKRLLDAPMSIDISGDSLPVELIPHVTDVVSDVRGQVAGRISLRGRLDQPSLAGALYISNTSVTLASTGMQVDDVTGVVRMANDVVTLGTAEQPISGVARGPIALRGTINVGEWRAPTFDLYLFGERAEVLNNHWGKVRADLGLALRGPVKSPSLSGQVTVTDGVIRAPEPTGKRVISAGDPALFNVLDTAMISESQLFPPSNPLLANMKVEMTLAINRDTWVRNQDANVEIYTEYPLRINVANRRFDVTGAVSTERGDYTFLSKRFQITRGSAMFIGAREIDNPTLQITGEYRVASGTGGGVDIKVLIGGTLKRPRLSLESDAQPPRSQSELISLLAFGQATTSVGSINAVSSLTAGGLSRETLSSGFQFAGRQLAGIALGVFVDEIEASLGRALATDYFNVTPADVPIELVSGTGLGTFFESTRFEGGKYLNSRTFVVGQMVGLGVPGARIQYRNSKGWRYEASLERRFLLEQPTLSAQTFKGKQGYGAFIVREWKF